MENAEAIKAMRHDMRHQLTVIIGYNNTGEHDKLGAYLAELIASIPVNTERQLCANFAVNAVAAHYLGLAESEGVAVNAKLDIPEDTGGVPAMDLCVIIGNLLENAVEACRRMKHGSKNIRVRSRTDGDSLTIVITNSFDGQWRMENSVFLSQKDGDKTKAHEGVGLSSVKAVCEKHRGLVDHDINGNIWTVTVLIHLEDSSYTSINSLNSLKIPIPSG